MKSSKRDQKSQERGLPLASAQIRAARSLIRWTAEDLASACALSVATIRRAELKEAATALTAANDLAIRHALESAGVEFIDEDGGGPGVRLRKHLQKKS
jgi:transcriptional regulator with XRE-family HTH domain